MTTNPNSAPAGEGLWTVNDVAAYLAASTSYVYKAAERAEIPCRRLGALLRFVPAEVRRWAEGGRATVHRLPVGKSRSTSTP